MRANPNLKSLSDNELLHRLSESTRQSRVVEVDVVALIAEVDARKLYAGEACSSMFRSNCTLESQPFGLG